MSEHLLLKKSVIAVALTLASTHVAYSQQVNDKSEIQKVIVTGSNIKHNDGETATPVQIFKRAEIQALGVNSVRELLDTLTSSTGSLSDIGGSNSFAGGASSASLRNLGKMSTLILLNSRRVAPYALADYNEVFTNLDSLPFDAVDRVEILRSGGSAVYGSDAVAGVINIITRSDYKGLQVSASRDTSLKNKVFNSTKASITGGFGDLATDKYNILANVELYKRSGVVWREVVEDINPYYATKFPAVKDGSGLSFGNRGTPSTFSYPGNIIGVGPIAGCATLNKAGLCVFDRYSRFEVQPTADRANLLVSGKLHISDTTEGFAEVLLSNTKTKYINAFPIYDSTGNDAVWGDPSTGKGKTFTSRYLPATHPLNPTGDEVPLRYRFADATSTRTSESSQYRALAGLKGSWNEYEWESAAGVMGSTSKDRSRGGMSDSGFKKVIGNYDPAQTDAQFFNRDYKIGKVNTPEVLNTLFPENGYDGKITQVFIDSKINGNLTTFNGRPVGIAAGFDIRHESFLISPTANLMAGDIVSNGAASANAARTHESVFAEMNVPVTSSLELQAAGRVDKFPGFAAHISPKLAARFEATKEFLIRGTIETGFRAPNLTESAQSSKFAFDNGINDPKRCSQAQALANDLRVTSDSLPATDVNKALMAARADFVEQNECAGGVANIVRNNPNLKPEKSNSISFGFVVAPVQGMNLSLDLWKIERHDEIGLKSTDDLLAAEDAQPAGIINRLSASQDKTFSAAERVKYHVVAGPLASTSGQFLNVSKTKTSGFDLGAASRFKTSFGKLEFTANATYLHDIHYYSSTLNGGSYGDNLAGRYGYPKVSANFGTNVSTGALTNGLRVTYQSSTSLNGDYFDNNYTMEGCKQKSWSTSDCKISTYARLDYNLTYTGFKGLTISAYVRNLTGKRPPIDLRAFQSGGSGIIPGSTEDVMGRSLRLALDYKFF